MGNKNFRYSASYAAGAMHAVFCEIEQNFYKSRIEQSNFEIGLKSKGLWKEIFKKYNLNETITSNDTLFYLKDKCSDFEKKNFEMACEIANNHKVLEKTSKNDLLSREQMVSKILFLQIAVVGLKWEFFWISKEIFLKTPELIFMIQ